MFKKYVKKFKIKNKCIIYIWKKQSKNDIIIENNCINIQFSYAKEKDYE